MDNSLTLGSLFDGSGGFPLGGLISGITPLWASEIEPFPIRVTTKRLPFMKHLGDISALNGATLPPVDIITFGSPCQDMSVAGKRAGLDGSRSNLFYEAVRIAKEMRHATDGRYPTWLCWENVHGAFSSNRGEDFKAVLDEIRRIKDPEADTPRPAKWQNAGCILADGYSVAWRVLDAQYWGVPQRRKRIFLVADLTGQCAGKVLFESEGMSGYTPASFRLWQGTADPVEESTGTSGSLCLNRNNANPTVYENHRQDARFTGPLKTAPTVMAFYGTGGNNQPFVIDIPERRGGPLSCDNDLLGSVPKSYGIDRSSFNMGANALYKVVADEEVQPPMVARGPGAVAQPVYTTSKASYHLGVEKDIAGTLVATDYKDPPTVSKDPYYIVRRLTPTECARLQGFPDWWCSDLETPEPTDEDVSFWSRVFDTHHRVTGTGKPKTDAQIIRWLSDPHSDSAEYKLWGNGVALPCVCFVLSGIVYFDRLKDAEST